MRLFLILAALCLSSTYMSAQDPLTLEGRVAALEKQMSDTNKKLAAQDAKLDTILNAVQKLSAPVAVAPAPPVPMPAPSTVSAPPIVYYSAGVGGCGQAADQTSFGACGSSSGAQASSCGSASSGNSRRGLWFPGKRLFGRTRSGGCG
jgi:hypothetical protein